MIFTCLGADEVEELYHEENDIDTSVPNKALNHFHLHHADVVRSVITVTNGALLSTDATSDGFTVDLTDPIMDKLVDGHDVDNDARFTVRHLVCFNSLYNENFISMQFLHFLAC